VALIVAAFGTLGLVAIIPVGAALLWSALTGPASQTRPRRRIWTPTPPPRAARSDVDFVVELAGFRIFDHPTGTHAWPHEQAMGAPEPSQGTEARTCITVGISPYPLPCSALSVV
jgi:hypothetical protein